MTITETDYFSAGEQRAFEMGNRGPIRFTDEGGLHPDIVEAYWRCGWYVFTDVIGGHEVEELRADVERIIDGAPVAKGSRVDRHGNPAIGADSAIAPYHLIRPLSDPWGGTDKLQGRHPHKMEEPDAPDDAPEWVPFIIRGLLQYMPSYLRLYGHPGLLGVAEQINGPDFTPFNETLFIKDAGLGGSVAWHQDGTTHWDSPDHDMGSHGFNLQVQLYSSTAHNGVWVVPGTHREPRADITAMIAANGGSDRLPGAVPIIAGPGDCSMTNRQTLHGSFANTSEDRRVTANFGFHRFRSVIGQVGGLSNLGTEYTPEVVRERCRSIQIAIDARSRHFPDETPFVYAPFVGDEDANRHNPETMATVMKDYDLRDLAI